VTDVTASVSGNTLTLSPLRKQKTSVRVIALYESRTRQKVKRAAPGGEGYVIDHFDRDAVRSYLATFETAFLTHRTPRPHSFFNDSYEVYGADWTPRLLQEFRQRRGYALEDHFDLLLLPNEQRTDAAKRVVSDYRETLGELLLENFTTQWTQWAHRGGATTRNQAHGSPANLIDIYAAVDVPECESFGLSNFGIKGLRTDEGYTKKNFSDISMLKYASSAAHISGKRLTSSETFTWLTEHFRTSLSQCKPDLDLLFVSGVNHVVFHGSCYSPDTAAWPGWRFYASVDFSPQNPWWSAMPEFSKYIARSQAFLQWGEPDNDFLVYLPYHDMIYAQPNRLALFDIHSMADRAPQFIATIQRIIAKGYDVDYISDKYLAQTHFDAASGAISTGHGAYKGIIVPDVRFMPLETLQHLWQLAESGAQVYFLGHLPESVPGLGRSAQQAAFDELIARFREKNPAEKDMEAVLQNAVAEAETMRTDYGLSCIRRTNPDGHHYFVSNLTPRDVDAFVPLAVPFAAAWLYNPLDGTVCRAQQQDGRIRLCLKSGQSVIVRTFASDAAADAAGQAKLPVFQPFQPTQEMTLRGWTLTFPQAAPKAIGETFRMDRPADWTTLPNSDLRTTMATGCYATSFKLKSLPGRALLCLGDVRETARVEVNGQTVATLFAVPYEIDIAPYLRKGRNSLKIYVSNLPANRIAEMDRQSIVWRKFKEINVVDLNYKRDNYANWAPVPSGLCSDVTLLLQE